jgi:uncharacterized protein (DUF58 family)
MSPSPEPSAVAGRFKGALATVRAWAQRLARMRHRGQHVTLEGAMFILVTMAIGFAANNTGNNLSYLFFSLMLAFLTVSAVVASQTLRGLSIERVVPRYIHAGEPFAVTLKLSNGKRWLSSYSLRAVDRLESRQITGACYSLRIPSRTSVESSYVTRINRRGAYRFASVRVYSTYPFGFFQRWKDFSCEQEIVVYPRMLPAGQWAVYSPVELGIRDSPQKGMGAEIHALRDYQPGDSARLIHWKVSARTGRLVAREFEREERRRVTLLLDNGVPDPSAPGVADNFERAVVACASMANAYLERDYQVQLITRSGRVPMSVGHSHLLRMLRSLALVDLVPTDGPPLWTPPPSKDESHIIVQFLGGTTAGLSPNAQALFVNQMPPFTRLNVAEGPLVTPEKPPAQEA